MLSIDKVPIFEKNRNGDVIGRNIIVTIFVDGKIRVKGPSDIQMTTHILKKAIEAIQKEKADTAYSGVEIVKMM